MPMTVVITRDVTARFRGFLTSCMLELAPGVYTQPAMTRRVRERVWRVLGAWHAELGTGSIVMTWRERSAPGGQGVAVLGLPIYAIVEIDDLYVVKREFPYA